MRRSAIDFRHVFSWFVFLVWSAVFGVFYFSGTYVEFLNPQFSLLILLGFILCSIFFIVLFAGGPKRNDCGHADSHHHSRASILRMLILLTPVMFALNYGSWQLGSFAFDKRAVGVTRVGGVAENVERAQTQASSSAETAPEDKAPIEVSLVEIHSKFENLTGRKVITQGMYMSETPGLPGDSYVIFRFLVVCCAADAQPLAVMVRGERPAGVSDEKWLQVEGILKSTEINGNTAVIIEAEKVLPVSAPKYPYMVPQMR